jgi:aldose sugar dehydrogenase
MESRTRRVLTPRSIATALALALGTALGASVLLAGGVLIRPGEVRDRAGEISLSAYPVQSGVNPTAMLVAPDGELVVAERSGLIRVFASGDADAALIASLQIPDVRESPRAGLLGLVLDPNFATNRNMYACVSRDPDGTGPEAWQNQLVTLTANADWQMEVSETIVRRLSLAAIERNGCGIAMDAERTIWVALGDSGNALRSLDPGSKLGKVLRIPAPAGGGDFEPIPSDELPDLVVATGLRDPVLLASDGRGTPAYLLDGGPRELDEVNALMEGSDYGWPCMVGTEPIPVPLDGRCPQEPAGVAPLWWPADGSRTPLGGLVALAGSEWGEWQGALLVSFPKSKDLRILTRSGDTFETAETLFESAGWRTGPLARGPEGEVYVSVGHRAGRQIVRIDPLP